MSKEYRIIPALDTAELDVALRLVCRTAGRESVYGYKLGFALGLATAYPRPCAASGSGPTSR